MSEKPEHEALVAPSRCVPTLTDVIRTLPARHAPALVERAVKPKLPAAFADLLDAWPAPPQAGHFLAAESERMLTPGTPKAAPDEDQRLPSEEIVQRILVQVTSQLNVQLPPLIDSALSQCLQGMVTELQAQIGLQVAESVRLAVQEALSADTPLRGVTTKPLDGS